MRKIFKWRECPGCGGRTLAELFEMLPPSFKCRLCGRAKKEWGLIEIKEGTGFGPGYETPKVLEEGKW